MYLSMIARCSWDRKALNGRRKFETNTSILQSSLEEKWQTCPRQAVLLILPFFTEPVDCFWIPQIKDPLALLDTSSSLYTFEHYQPEEPRNVTVESFTHHQPLPRVANRWRAFPHLQDHVLPLVQPNLWRWPSSQGTCRKHLWRVMNENLLIHVQFPSSKKVGGIILLGRHDFWSLRHACLEKVPPIFLKRVMNHVEKRNQHLFPAKFTHNPIIASMETTQDDDPSPTRRPDRGLLNLFRGHCEV